LVLVVLSGFGLWNPLNVYLGWAAGLLFVLVPLAVTIPAFALLASARSRALRLCLGVAGTVLALLSTGLSLMWLMVVGLAGDVPGAREEQVVAVQGQYQLVQVGPHPHGPFYRIELRRSLGPFSQRTVVWRARELDTPPSAAWFTGPHSVAVSTSNPSCTHHSTFSGFTLTPDPEPEPPFDAC
jgi:hypothetical protein